jgi:hypothetical protein
MKFKATEKYNPIAMLREAMLKIEADESGLTKAEKWTKHLERLKDHEFLIYEHEQKFKTAPADHICDGPFCGNPGSISSSTTGGGNYYCQEHYRRAG